MKIKSILTSVLVISMLLSSTTAAFASGNNVTNNSNYSKISAKDQKSIDERKILIDKMNPYVLLDPETKQYELKVTAENDFTKSEIKEVNKLIDISNKTIREAIKNNETLTVTPQNTVKGTPNTSADNGEIQASYINTSLYWDYEFCWWGERIFLHNNLVNDLGDWGNTVLGGVGITAVGLNNALVSLGLSGNWAAFVCALYAGAVAYVYDSIQNDNNGYGVYCDSFYGINYWDIYAAW